jgi:hypothetical protein
MPASACTAPTDDRTLRLPSLDLQKLDWLRDGNRKGDSSISTITNGGIANECALLA